MKMKKRGGTFIELKGLPLKEIGCEMIDVPNFNSQSMHVMPVAGSGPGFLREDVLHQWAHLLEQYLVDGSPGEAQRIHHGGDNRIVVTLKEGKNQPEEIPRTLDDHTL